MLADILRARTFWDAQDVEVPVVRAGVGRRVLNSLQSSTTLGEGQTLFWTPEQHLVTVPKLSAQHITIQGYDVDTSAS